LQIRDTNGVNKGHPSNALEQLQCGALLALKLLDDFMAPELALKGSRCA
jgi:hypothetical protein